MDKLPSRAAPQRTYFAAGDYITRHPPGSAEEIVIDSPREKRGWNAGTPGTQMRPAFPGAAVRIDDRYYEVVRVARQPGEQPRHLYFLNPWPDHFPIRTQFAYTREECERIAAEQKLEEAEGIAQTLLNLFSPLVGLLPAPDQRQLENSYGISALQCTLRSGFMMMAIGAVSLMLGLVAIITPGSSQNWPIIGAASPLALALFGVAVCGESVLRLTSTKHDEPMGSFLVAVPVQVLRMLRSAVDPNRRRRRFEKMEAGSAFVFLNALDEVRTINETDFEILSILPKPDWGAMTGILFNDTWYGCIESRTVSNGKDTRYRFLLRKAPEGTTFRTTCKYRPEEIRDRYREKRRQELKTWVETFAPFWGLLDGPDQRKLEQVYGFKPLKYTSWTIAILTVVGAANLAVSTLNITAGVARPADIVWLLCAAYLLIESFVRLQKWMKKEPSGSVLGILLHPFASRLLNV